MSSPYLINSNSFSLRPSFNNNYVSLTNVYLYDLDSGYDLNFVDVSGNNTPCILVMPLLSYDGISFSIKRIDNSTNDLTLQLNQSDNKIIDGSLTSIVLKPLYSYSFYSFNSSWYLTNVSSCQP